MQYTPTDEIQIISILLIGISLLVLMGIAIILFFYFSRKKIIKTELEKANLQIAHQQEVLQASLQTQEAERKRIAQDLHDDISSKLNIVSLNANFLTDQNITPQEAIKLGGSIAKVTATVLESSRRIAHELLPPALEKFGLVPALEELCDQVEECGTLQVTSRFQYEEGIFSKEEGLHVFRIVQELVNNTLKYAKAKTTSIALVAEKNTVTLQYKDNGKGFALEDGKKVKGLGLSGIENRAAILNATVEIVSAPGEGMQVVLTKQTN